MGPLCRSITAGRRPATVSIHKKLKLALAIIDLLAPLDSLYLAYGLHQGHCSVAGSQKLESPLCISPFGEMAGKWIYPHPAGYVHHWLKFFCADVNGLRVINVQTRSLKVKVKENKFCGFFQIPPMGYFCHPCF